MTDIENTPVASKTPKPRVRRVGAITMGLTLIVAGISIVSSLVVPDLDLSFLLKIAPLSLVILGGEVLFYSFKPDSVTIKYDILSMLICFVLSVAAIGVTLLSPYLGTFSPDRTNIEMQLSDTVYDSCYTQLTGNDKIEDFSTNVHLKFYTGEEEVDITHPSLDVTSSITLNGPYESKEQFAVDSREILTSLEKTEIDFSNIYIYCTMDGVTKEQPIRYSLNLESRYVINKTAAQLVEMVNYINPEVPDAPDVPEAPTVPDAPDEGVMPQEYTGDESYSVISPKSIDQVEVYTYSTS